MVRVNSTKCTGCGYCVDVCPQQAITIDNNDVAMVNQELCSQCGNCAAICPTNAIQVVEPVYAPSGKGGDQMRRRGWFGWGHRAWGKDNPYPFCRFYPWLPQRWWTYGPGLYPQIMPTYYPVYRPYRWR
jgi:Fe-S-cluster-containing hydrogenase component 2